MSAMTTPCASSIAIAMERGPAQSPVALDALRTLARQASFEPNKRAARPLVGLGFNFLMEVPSIHHILQQETHCQSADDDREHTQTEVLNTPACEALFDTPYVDNLLDVLSPEGPSYAEQRLSQALWAIVIIVQWFFQPALTAFCGIVTVFRLEYHAKAETLLKTPCTMIVGFSALVVFATINYIMFCS